MPEKLYAIVTFRADTIHTPHWAGMEEEFLLTEIRKLGIILVNLVEGDTKL